MVSINARLDIDVTVLDDKICIDDLGIFINDQRLFSNQTYYDADGNDGLIGFLEREAQDLLRHKLEQYKNQLMIEGQR